MKILVTGSAGFIGTHLCRELRDHGHHVYGWDIAEPLYTNRWHPDFRDPDTTRIALDTLNPDLCVHLAAKVGRLFGEDDLAATIADNAAMTANVAWECGRRGVKMVYASTSEVYGDLGNELAFEDRPFHRVPHNLYGLSKRWGEEACRLYAPKGLLIWRISMPYGPGLPAGVGRAAMINFLYNALHQQCSDVHYGSERSWCWIGDTVRAMRMTIERGCRGAYNIGRDDAAESMWDVAVKAYELCGVEKPQNFIRLIEPPARQTVVKRLSTDKIRGLGWRPEVDLDDGMRRTLEWVKTLPAPKTTVLAA